MPGGIAAVYIIVAIGILVYGAMDYVPRRYPASLLGTAVAALVLLLLLSPELMVVNLFVRFDGTGNVGSWVLSALHRATRLSIITYGGLILVSLALVAWRPAAGKGGRGKASRK